MRKQSCNVTESQVMHFLKKQEAKEVSFGLLGFPVKATCVWSKNCFHGHYDSDSLLQTKPFCTLESVTLAHSNTYAGLRGVCDAGAFD